MDGVRKYNYSSERVALDLLYLVSEKRADGFLWRGCRSMTWFKVMRQETLFGKLL